MKTQKTLAYLDTNVLLDMMDHNTSSVDMELKRAIHGILNKHKIKIPQIVLGETLAVILNNTTDIGKIMPYVDNVEKWRKNLTFDSDKFPPTTNEIMEIACELHVINNRINNMDSLILAHSISDNDAIYFFTKDKNLKIDEIHEYISKRIKDKKRDQILNIPSNFSEY